MSKNKQENKQAAWRKKFAAQPLWVKLSFVLAVLLIVQIALRWDHFVEGLLKGLDNYGITIFKE